jgi:hypothetical protein
VISLVDGAGRHLRVHPRDLTTVSNATIYIIENVGVYMPEYYESAAIRHLEDALTLQSSGRGDNAGHLVGFAAECAIKYQIENLRPQNNSPHGHIPELLIAARKHLGARVNYSNMYDILKGDVFEGWNVNLRYYETGHTRKAELENWFSVTKRLFAIARLKVRK